MGRSARLVCLTGVAAVAAVVPAGATAALTATGVTPTGRPAYVQVVVPFSGGVLTAFEREVDAVDPRAGDGRAIVRVNGRGITARPVTVTRAGVTARLVRRPGSVLVVLRGTAGLHKFVSYAVDGSRTRLVIRLWRATTSARARRLDDGCLRLSRWSARSGVRARGLEREPLFEHGLVLSLRAAGAGAATLAERGLIATEGTFRPDFSGYLVPGRWRGTLAVPAGTPPGTRVMLEARAESAKDGSLECLVQTPVVLRP